MFQRIIDDFRERTGAALRLTSLAGLTLLALLITAAFLLAAGFIYVLQEYGPIQACLAGAGVFFVVTLIAAGCYVGRKNRTKVRAAEAARAAASAQSPLVDPMLIATGLQLVRAIGIKRLIPLLALAGLALGAMASRNATGKAEGADDPES